MIKISFLLSILFGCMQAPKHPLASKYSQRVFYMRDAVWMTNFLNMYDYQYKDDGRHWYCLELDGKNSKATMAFIDGKRKEFQVWSTKKPENIILFDGNITITAELSGWGEGDNLYSLGIILFPEKKEDPTDYKEWFRNGRKSNFPLRECVAYTEAAFLTFQDIEPDDGMNKVELTNRKCLWEYRNGHQKKSIYYEECNDFPFGDLERIPKADRHLFPHLFKEKK